MRPMASTDVLWGEGEGATIADLYMQYNKIHPFSSYAPDSP